MNRTDIERCLPHRSTALWLDAVSYIDDSRIVGSTTENCLSLYGENSSASLLYEAAAQLCAVHGASKSNVVKRGYVVKVRHVVVHQPQAVSGVFTVQCIMLSKNAIGALYQFDIARENKPVLSGNLLVVIENA